MDNPRLTTFFLFFFSATLTPNYLYIVGQSLFLYWTLIVLCVIETKEMIFKWLFVWIDVCVQWRSVPFIWTNSWTKMSFSTKHVLPWKLISCVFLSVLNMFHISALLKKQVGGITPGGIVLELVTCYVLVVPGFPMCFHCKLVVKILDHMCCIYSTTWLFCITVYQL